MRKGQNMRGLVLAALMNKIGEYVSGEDICRALGVTRAAVWRVVNDLRVDGYRVEASPRLGYRLRVVPDCIEPLFIKQLLETRLLGREVVFLKECDSTNQHAKLLGDHAAPHGTLVVAENQGKGVHMSLLLRPELAVDESQKLTMIAALAAAMCIEECTEIKPGIKWPSDILIEDKKVCSILTHMAAEQWKLAYAVVGVELEVGKSTVQASRVPLIVAFCNHFERLYEDYLQTRDFTSFMTKYRPYSVTLGRDVKVSMPGRDLEGTALYFDDDGMLVILSREGRRERIQAGEAQVRGLMGAFW
ncbi:MAG: biotin--[acetyl-CoA-carboxylase] ligase [Clostridia bacterium]|nr:biotin--[acetyl-CoA-carboxylase] ligase [Clostridia bacterium]